MSIQCHKLQFLSLLSQGDFGPSDGEFQTTVTTISPDGEPATPSARSQTGSATRGREEEGGFSSPCSSHL